MQTTASSDVVTAGPRARGRGEAPLILGLGGTTRTGSTSERALLYALDVAEAAGGRTLALTGAELDLPMFPADHGERTPAARTLVDAVRVADGLIVASPGYHGGISGMLKNALDYVEDLRDATPPYLDDRAVGCIVCASGWQATTTTLVALRSVVHALRGWPTPLGVAINSADGAFDAAGRVDERIAASLRTMAEQVVRFARMRRAAAA
jgi:FMN reductase